MKFRSTNTAQARRRILFNRRNITEAPMSPETNDKMTPGPDDPARHTPTNPTELLSTAYNPAHVFIDEGAKRRNPRK